MGEDEVMSRLVSLAFGRCKEELSQVRRRELVVSCRWELRRGISRRSLFLHPFLQNISRILSEAFFSLLLEFRSLIYYCFAGRLVATS